VITTVATPLVDWFVLVASICFVITMAALIDVFLTPRSVFQERHRSRDSCATIIALLFFTTIIFGAVSAIYYFLKIRPELHAPVAD